MITITGNTFPHRTALKQLGARWDKDVQWWTLDRASAADLAALRAMVGVTVRDYRPPSLRPDTPRPSYRKPTQFFGDDDRYRGYFKGDPTAFFGFSSLAAMCDFVAAIPPDPPLRKPSIAWSTAEKVQRWTATADMGEALKLARDGWTDGLGITDMLTVDGAKRRQRRHDVVGSAVNVGRMLAGDPRCMRRRVPLPGSKFIRLFVDCGLWKGIGATIAMFRAFIIAGMIDLLEREGYRCEIIALDCTRHFSIRREKAHWAVTVKEAREPLSLFDISFALGHPAMCRRLGFALTASVPDCFVDETDHCVVSEAFDEDHTPGPNEFYIPALTPTDVAGLDESDPMAILPLVQPEGLPITITGVR